MENEKREKLINGLILRLCIEGEEAREEAKKQKENAGVWKDMYFGKSDENATLVSASEKYSLLLTEMTGACEKDSDFKSKVEEYITGQKVLAKEYAEDVK